VHFDPCAVEACLAQCLDELIGSLLIDSVPRMAAGARVGSPLSDQESASRPEDTANFHKCGWRIIPMMEGTQRPDHGRTGVTNGQPLGRARKESRVSDALPCRDPLRQA
jgi:hypothetical protein